MRRRGVLAIGVLAAAMATTVAGCGSDSGDSSSGSSSSSNSSSGGAAAKQPTGSTIKLGIVSPKGTPAFNDVWGPAAAKAAVAALNASGGLMGHKVELEYCNDKGDPNQTVTCARQFIQDKVVAQVGGTALNDAALVNTLKSGGVPMVGFNPFTTWAAKNVYPLTGGSYFDFQMLNAWAGNHGTKLALIASDNQTSTAMRPVLLKTYADSGGGAYTASVLVSPTQSDFSPLVQAAEAGGQTEGALMFVGTEQLVQFYQASKSAGAKYQFYTATPYQDDTKSKIDPEQVNNSVFASPYPPFNSDNPMIQQFVKDMKVQEDTGDKDAAIGEQDFESFSAWLAVQVIKKVVERDKLSDITAATVTKALDATKDLDLAGVIPPWTPSDPGPPGFPRASNTAAYVGKYVDGEPQLLTKSAVPLTEAIQGNFGATH